MKSFKFIFSLALFLAFASCVEKNYIIVDDETVTVDPNDDTNSGTNDNDGDGVTNQQEAVDNTDPDDPCSVKLGSQYGPDITDAWKALDCDGDGVTNGQELIDLTGLLDPNGYDICDFVEEHQDPTQVTELWQSYDCDGDSVTNGVELLTDNTDINDRCDFNLASYDASNSQDWWLEFDCDEDGRSNGIEIDAGTDPLDPDSFPGSGEKIVSVHVGETYQTHLFTHEGTRYDKIVGANNELLTDFTYDAQGNLISVFVKDESGNDDITINYTYTNNQVSKVEINEGGDLSAFDVVHDVNTMSTFEIDGGLPSGIYTKQYTFDPVTNKVLTIGNFYVQTSLTLAHQTDTFTYNGPDGDVSRSEVTGQTYNIADQTFSAPSATVYSRSYTYEANGAKNPFYNAGQSIYKNYLLTPIILEKCWVRWHGAFSKNYREESNFSSPGLYVQYINRVSSVQTNGFPATGITRESWGQGIPTEFYYEE